MYNMLNCMYMFIPNIIIGQLKSLNGWPVTYNLAGIYIVFNFLAMELLWYSNYY